jgi:hypothetical protein
MIEMSQEEHSKIEKQQEGLVTNTLKKKVLPQPFF